MRCVTGGRGSSTLVVGLVFALVGAMGIPVPREANAQATDSYEFGAGQELAWGGGWEIDDDFTYVEGQIEMAALLPGVRAVASPRPAHKSSRCDVDRRNVIPTPGMLDEGLGQMAPFIPKAGGGYRSDVGDRTHCRQIQASRLLGNPWHSHTLICQKVSTPALMSANCCARLVSQSIVHSAWSARCVPSDGTPGKYVFQEDQEPWRIPHPSSSPSAIVW
jgi:hypothetical protein